MFTLIDALERKPKGKPDMSPHAANSLVHDLVQMAQAMERLPQVEADLSNARDQEQILLERIASMSNDIDQAKAYASTLEQRLHDAEVAKDAAETMFLEADDRTSQALDFIKATFGNAGTLIQALEPPRAEPPKVEQTVETGPVTEREYAAYTQAQPDQPDPIVSEVKPIQEWSGSPNPANPDHEWIKDDTGEIIPAQGQSEPGPTVTSVAEHGSQGAHVNPETVQQTMPSPALGPYSGKRYHDLPTYVPLDDWLAGGGTDADYHWRPAFQF